MPSPSIATSSLRAYILKALSTVPGSRIFHLHVLVSTPRKPEQSPFLYADTRPKCLMQDVLVLLSEETPKSTEDSSSLNPPLGDDTTESTSRVFVSAIEAFVHAFPASGSTVLYISKVDGTGQGDYPSPTSTLVRAFLLFYASSQSPLFASRILDHHLWIHLFARSQRQYLFPNSADHHSKKPLGDVALCKWWKKLLSDVAKAVEIAIDANVASDAVVPNGRERRTCLYYILPGQSEPEASYLLRDPRGSSSLPRVSWNYSHPYKVYVESSIPVPSGSTLDAPKDLSEIPPLAYLIPHFEDDPKTRFLDELSATSEEQAIAVPVPTPRRKRQKTSDSADAFAGTSGSEENNKAVPDGVSVAKKDKIEAQVEEKEQIRHEPPPPAPAIMYIPPSSSPPQAASPSPPPRPSTPEIVGATKKAIISPHTPHLPTFPASLLSPHTPTNTRGPINSPSNRPSHTFFHTPQTPRTPRRPRSDLDTISPDEFWERMSFRQECSLGAVTGFFVAIFSQRFIKPQGDRTNVQSPLSSNATSDENNAINTGLSSTLLSTGTIPHSVIKRVMSSLLTGVEFSTVERARKGTYVMESAIKGLCEGLGDDKSATKNLKPENAAPGTAPDFYTSHVYASLSTTNKAAVRHTGDTHGGAVAGGTTTVNVLGVRRKRKKE